MDAGAPYGNRGNGYTYGWSGNNTGNAFDRNSPLSPDQRYDTLIEITKGNTGNRWEIELPNGTYQVYIVAGDPANFNSTYRINAEGLLTVSGTPNSSTRWISGTRDINVSDGRLTITSGSGAKNNEICFIEITPATGLTGLALREPGARPALSVEADGDSIRLRLASEDFTIEASTDLEVWVPLTLTRQADGSISVPAGKDQSFFRAVKH
jgi:hypothetical protein